MTKYIKFTIGGVFDGYKTVEISIGTKNVSYKILRDGLNEVDKKNSRNVEVSNEWLNEFDALDIFSWKEDYTAANVLDGTQWELIFKWGKKSCRVYGSNAYPEDFWQFLDWLDKLIPEMHFVNRKRIEKITLDYYRTASNGCDVAENLTIDRHEKTLVLDIENIHTKAKHIYDISSVEAEVFDAAQDFFDNLETRPSSQYAITAAKIEVVHHDGSVKNFETDYGELCMPGLKKFIGVIKKNVVIDLFTEITSVPDDEEIQTGKYIFCKVQFKGSYKSYSYRTDDETLAVGDIVDVPVGKNNDVAQAKIVEIGYFDEEEAPFPVDKIKSIIGKHIAGDWENY